MKQLFILTFLILHSSLSAFAQSVLSPDGTIRVTPRAKCLSVEYKCGSSWQQIMAVNTNATRPQHRQTPVSNVDYTMPVGKKSHCTNSYRQQDYSVAGKKDAAISVRVYDDGVAFKAISPNSVDVSVPCMNSWLMQWHDSYEDFFIKNRELKDGQRLAYPALFEYGNNVFALLSESGLDRTNAATSMYSKAANVFTLRPEGEEQGGWQTVIIGSLSDIVESTLITDNSAPAAFSSYGTPGVASWIYWANNHGSNNYGIIKKYVDMAAGMHLPYVLIDAEWDDMDKVAANEGKTIEDAVRYAVDHGVMPMIWYNSSVGWINGAPGPKFRLNKPEDREREFAWCERIGVKGVKIDFFSGDNNMNISYMADLLECAAKHNLLVNFHGVTTMRGWQRTYPNLITCEAVYGAEWYNNVPTFTRKAASHNAMLPFTRNVIGSMDYTPCAFSDSQHPHITTHAHELALTALYESAIQHIADSPESLLAQPLEVRNYLSTLPTTWDETRYISGYPGESVVLARRKGSVWYVAGINGTDGVMQLPVGSVWHGRAALIFEDGNPSKNPWKITRTASLDVDTFTCQPRGGFVMVIK